ncbi:MAG: hypothetical protein M1831_007544 [Alyxoria varia]|nr:MAG: hypothetical protein M1831_007544 [Alyxoria varia]
MSCTSVDAYSNANFETHSGRRKDTPPKQRRNKAYTRQRKKQHKQDRMDPTGPSQPKLDQAYEAAGNPAQKQPAERAAAASNAQAPGSDGEGNVRIPREQGSYEDATSSSLGYGAPPSAPLVGEESRGLTDADVGRHRELDGDTQMSAAGEGDIRDAVVGNGKNAVGGEQAELVKDMDRKKEEQRPMREAIQGERAKLEGRGEGVDVQGALRDR